MSKTVDDLTAGMSADSGLTPNAPPMLPSSSSTLPQRPISNRPKALEPTPPKVNADANGRGVGKSSGKPGSAFDDEIGVATPTLAPRAKLGTSRRSDEAWQRPVIYAFVGVVALVFVMIVVGVVRKNVDAPNWRQWFTVPEHDATAKQPLPVNHPAAIPSAPLPTDTDEPSDPDAPLAAEENPEAPVAETPTDGTVPTDTSEPQPTEPVEVNPFEPAP